MSFRRIAEIWGAGSALALALMLPTPVAAADAVPGDRPSYPTAAPDMRPEWRGGSSYAAQVDPRARDAWLHECRHRTAFYYDNGGYRHHRHNDRDGSHAPGYDYCEAYFDDYYRTYSQPGYAYAYAVPAIGYMRPVAAATTQYVQSSRPVEEVITERYEPMRSRLIPRRHVHRALHDKRIRVAP